MTGSLRAVSVPLGPGPAVDPYALAGERGILFANDRLVLAGRGTAAVLALPRGLEDPADLDAVQAWLAAVPHDDRVGRTGSRVTAFGALAFDRSAAGRLLVPELLIGLDHAGRRWATLVSADADPARLGALVEELVQARSVDPDPIGSLTAGREAALLFLTALPPGEEHAKAVAVAVADIEAGHLRKVVLARCVEAAFDAPPPLDVVVRRLRAQEPSCTTFALPLTRGRFLGASPELLVRRQGAAVSSHPLAGTVGLTGDSTDVTATERLLGSAKDQAEHRWVVEAIAAALGPRCERLSYPSEPTLVQLRSVAHLGTPMEGTLRTDRGSLPSVLELLTALHPTPAVGGVPRPAALEAIAALEPTPRGHWAGPVGWVDAAGDGEWVIGLRSATVNDQTVRFCAGGGIVAGSDPQAELAETTVKLAPILEAFAPGAACLL